MSFLAPLYLLLGAAAAVPLLLHLLRRRIGNRVEFPAARYLQRAEQEHSRSLRLRNLLLMLLRVMLILTLALAAAQPFIRGVGVGHGATAVGIVLDNSLSTSALASGAPVFEQLRHAARDLLLATTAEDRLWLATADGQVRSGTREALLGELEAVTVIEDAGDLPLAVRRIASAVQEGGLPAHVVAVATDGQRSAWSGAARLPAASALALFAPSGDPPVNRAVLDAAAEPSRWTPRGAVIGRVESNDSVGYRIILGERTIARGAAGHGEPVLVRVSPPERGWQSGRIELEPDEFAADDRRYFAVWIGGPPAVTSAASSGQFASTAIAALVADGRATVGSGVQIASADAASSLPALLVPPSDPVRLGAANRALARLGIPWRFGSVDRSSALVRGARLDGVSVTERYRLIHESSGASDTLSTVGSEPWIVAGPGYVLVGSRLEPSATNLPVRAVFVPWMADVIGLRLGAPSGDVGMPRAVAPGASLDLPADVDALESANGDRRSVGREHTTAPQERGVWFLLKAGRRVGAVVVNAPAEESALARYSARELAARLGGAQARASSSARTWVGDALVAGDRRPVATPLLLLALVLVAAEAVVVRTSRSAAA